MAAANVPMSSVPLKSEPSVLVVPESALSVASFDGRVTVTVYVCVLSPSWAVTFTSMTVSPTATAMAALAEPLVTDARVSPCLPTFTVASDWFTVGVSFTCVTALATVAV